MRTQGSLRRRRRDKAPSHFTLHAAAPLPHTVRLRPFFEMDFERRICSDAHKPRRLPTQTSPSLKDDERRQIAVPPHSARFPSAFSQCAVVYIWFRRNVAAGGKAFLDESECAAKRRRLLRCSNGIFAILEPSCPIIVCTLRWYSDAMATASLSCRHECGRGVQMMTTELIGNLI